MRTFSRFLAGMLFGLLSLSAMSRTPPQQVGVVLMHGLTGHPMSMSTLAYALRQNGYQVSNLEMPWSMTRMHDAPVESAERMVLDEFEALRRRGVRKLFVAGFSKGGMFAAYFASRHRIDGLIAIAPNGGSNTTVNSKALEQARALVAAGEGDRQAMLDQFSPMANRTYPMPAVPSAYLSWFDPEGPMHAVRIYESIPPGLPVLLVVPTHDYPNLLRAKDAIFAGLPPNPLHRLYEPDATHAGAVNASADEAVRWIARVAGGAAVREMGAAAHNTQLRSR